MRMSHSILTRLFIVGALAIVAAQVPANAQCTPQSQYLTTVWTTTHPNCATPCDCDIPLDTHDHEVTVYTTLRGATCCDCNGYHCCFKTIAKSVPQNVTKTFYYSPNTVIQCGGKVIENVGVLYEINQGETGDPYPMPSECVNLCGSNPMGCVAAYYHSSQTYSGTDNQPCSGS